MRRRQIEHLRTDELLLGRSLRPAAAAHGHAAPPGAHGAAASAAAAAAAAASPAFLTAPAPAGSLEPQAVRESGLAVAQLWGLQGLGMFEKPCLSHLNVRQESLV
jgi:hypothetical protein